MDVCDQKRPRLVKATGSNWAKQVKSCSGTLTAVFVVNLQIYWLASEGRFSRDPPELKTRRVVRVVSSSWHHLAPVQKRGVAAASSFG